MAIRGDELYYEIFISDDTQFTYGKMFDLFPIDLRYEILEESIQLYRYDDRSTFKLSLELISEGSIRLKRNYDSFRVSSAVVEEDLLFNRISTRDIKLGEVTCWGKYNEEFNCQIFSKDRVRYDQAFAYRRAGFFQNKENNSMK